MRGSSHHEPVRHVAGRRLWRTCAGFLFTLAFLVCGCTSPREYVRNGFKVGPNYGKPPAPVEQNWIDAGDKRLDSRTPANVEWWTVLNDPVLNNLIKRAYRENLTLRQAAYRVLEFQAARAIAAGNLFPQTQQFNGSYTANAISGVAGTVASLEQQAGARAFSRFFNTWQGGFNLAWELDFWGRLRRALESADASLDASIEDYDNALVTLIGNVASTYVNIRTFQTRIKLANDNLILQRKTYEIAKVQWEKGAKDKLAFDQAEANLAQVESLIPQLEISQRQAENQLCILLGMPPQELAPLIGTASIPKVSPDLVVGIPAELLRRRPDVLSAERQAAAQSALIGFAEAELYPHISITGTISWQASRFQDLFGGRAMAGSVGPSLQWDILNYGRLVNGVRVQDARFQQLVVSYQNVVLKAESEVENAITSYLKSHQVVRALGKGVLASQSGARIGEDQYVNGKIPFVTLALLQQNLVTQQDQLATAYGNLVQALIQTYQALGGGWQIRLQDNGQGPDDTVAPAPPKEVPNIDPKDLPLSSRAAPSQQLAATLGPGDVPTREVPIARIDVQNVR
jgi:NodT family efflux transporter outer membrane factor (OMF) lipoprotein